VISPFFTAALLQASAATSAPRPAEVWEPWLTWGCLVREPKGKPFVVNGVVARRNEPNHPIDYLRHERALRVLRDDSGTFTGLQARAPLFVVRPTEFWAIFYRNEAGAAHQQGRMTLKVPQMGGRGSADLFRAGAGTKPYATGPCVSRVEPQKAKL
jgi:hypothetical protein